MPKLSTVAKGYYHGLLRENSSSWQWKAPGKTHAIAVVYEPYAVTFCIYNSRTRTIKRVTDKNRVIQRIAKHFMLDLEEIKAGTWESKERKTNGNKS